MCYYIKHFNEMTVALNIVNEIGKKIFKWKAQKVRIKLKMALFGFGFHIKKWKRIIILIKVRLKVYKAISGRM